MRLREDQLAKELKEMELDDLQTPQRGGRMGRSGLARLHLLVAALTLAIVLKRSSAALIDFKLIAHSAEIGARLKVQSVELRFWRELLSASEH